jgi:hypothetical protein
MFNIYSFLIGALAVFVISTLVYIIGESSLFPNYDGEDFLLVFTQLWWTIPFSILTFLWKHRLIQVVSLEQYKRVCDSKYDFDVYKICNNVFLVRANADKEKHPILYHVRIVLIVKNNKKVVDGMR